MQITLPEYIKSPMGGMVLSQREMFKRIYQDKFDKLLLRENGKIDYTLYTNDDKYLIHFKIPSEAIHNFYYDVVFEFSPAKKENNSESTLENYYVKFFSNDPSFIFTYAYVFKEKNLLIEDLKAKIGAKASDNAPKVTNPQKIVGYVKSFYFAYLMMKRKGLFKKVVFSGCRKYYKTPFLLTITSAQSKVDERIEKGKELSKRNRIRRNILKNDSGNANNVVHGKSVKSTSTSKTIGSIKRSSGIKSVRSIKRK